MRVAEIRIYPVKGMRGLSVPEAIVEPWGLEGDRRYMVVDASGRFLTQRQLPRMALIGACPVPGGLELTAPGVDPVRVEEPGPGTPPVVVQVWKDRVAARDVGDVASVWLSSALGVACRLVHMADPAAARPVDPDYGEAGDSVSFADGFPLLITNAASVADLNGCLARPVSMDCFRTNVAVEGAPPWAEDDWFRLRIGSIPFDGAKDCARCAVTTVDQDSGARSPENEPLFTLSLFRRRAGGRIVFGKNLIPRGAGRIAVGDPVLPLP